MKIYSAFGKIFAPFPLMKTFKGDHVQPDPSRWTVPFKYHSHCNENLIYVFLFWELRGLSPKFHIHVSVNDLYIPRIGPAAE
jgi:hypothetical protein